MFALKPGSLIGSRIGQFRVDEFIARGAMGMVFKGFDTVLERTVALKLIPKTSDPLAPWEVEAEKRFVQEAKATAQISDHPNIVTIHTFGETELFRYICMEYVSGMSLAQVLRAERLIPVEKALRLFEQILSGIHAAHSAEIIHRDIKPSNIMITDNDEVRLVDFGIAKVASLSITAKGSLLGTPYYMSPEQIAGGGIDGRADIYSIGAVLYQVLTGERPFEGESATAVIYKIMSTEPVPPGEVNPLIPEPLCGMIRKAMAKNPRDRYQTSAEMLQAIRDVMKATRRDAPAGLRPGARQLSGGEGVRPRPSPEEGAGRREEPAHGASGPSSAAGSGVPPPAFSGVPEAESAEDGAGLNPSTRGNRTQLFTVACFLCAAAGVCFLLLSRYSPGTRKTDRAGSAAVGTTEKAPEKTRAKYRILREPYPPGPDSFQEGEGRTALPVSVPGFRPKILRDPYP